MAVQPKTRFRKTLASTCLSSFGSRPFPPTQPLSFASGISIKVWSIYDCDPNFFWSTIVERAPEIATRAYFSHFQTVADCPHLAHIVTDNWSCVSRPWSAHPIDDLSPCFRKALGQLIELQQGKISFFPITVCPPFPLSFVSSLCNIWYANDWSAPRQV